MMDARELAALALDGLVVRIEASFRNRKTVGSAAALRPVVEAREALRSGDVDKFHECMTAAFDACPYRTVRSAIQGVAELVA